MKVPRALAVFLCTIGAALALGIGKALLVSGWSTLPPVNTMIFAGSYLGVVVVLLDWALLRDVLPRGPKAAAIKPPRINEPSRTISVAQLRPILFREVCPPSEATGLSYYGGVPIGPSQLSWPRSRNKPDNPPLSFIMQWDCAELAGQDPTGLLPNDGVLYLFADLTWDDARSFEFVHAPGPTKGWTALPVPSGLPPVYGDDGAGPVPYCSSRVPAAHRYVPRLLPKWPFTPLTFPYPAQVPSPAADGEEEQLFWEDGERTAEALLSLQHPGVVPPPKPLDNRQVSFVRPFETFPHDYAAVRVVAAKVLDRLRFPSNGLLRQTGQQEREAAFEDWRNQAIERYVSAAAHDPAAAIGQSESGEMWRWMQGLEPVLAPGWGSLIDECVNVSLGLASEAAATLPAALVAVAAEHHRFATAYLHEEYADRSTLEALANWEARKSAGSLKQVRSVHAPCPNHMFGPPSYVQGYVEEYMREWILLLELSSHRPIGHEFGEGVLQFMIRPADLRERRFDQVKLIASAY